MGNSNQTKPAGILKILWEGLKLPVNNRTLLHSVVTVSFLSSSLLFLFSYLCLLDLTTKSILTHKADPESIKFSLLLTAILEDSEELGIVAVIFHIISFVINSLVAIATVHVLSAAYASKIALEIKELFSRLNQPLIKRAMITQVLVAFLQLGCILIVSLPTGVLSFLYANSGYFSHSSTVIIVLGVTVAALAFYWYLYWLMVAQISVVVSIAEEGCYGLDAIAKACKLIGGGTKQANLIAFGELTTAVVYYMGYGIVMAHIPPIKMAQLALGVGHVAIGVVIRVLVWSVLTVYYYERSKIRAEEIATKGGFKYNSVPTQVNEALP